MKTKYILQIFTTVMLLLTTVTNASAKDNTVVFGTGDPNIDVAAVQQAVDTSNVVRLSGTFDFGEEGSVSIFNDVEIYGESATIKNGKQTFAVGFDPSLPDGGDARHQPGFVGPKVVFKNLNFENALYSTIHVLAASGLTVEDCTFTDGRYFNYWGSAGTSASVWIDTNWSVWNPYSGEASNVTGSIVIKNNSWEGNSRIDYENGLSPYFGVPIPMNGIQSPFMMIGGKDVHVTIKNNVSKNAGWYHFTVNDVQGEESTIQVENNTVENDESSVACISTLLLSDMYAWTSETYPGLSEIEAGDPDVNLIVRGNKATFHGQTIAYTQGAYIGNLNNASITNNIFDIATEGHGCGGGGIGLTSVRDSMVKNNIITQNDNCDIDWGYGDAYFAWSFGIVVWDGNGPASEGNTIENNEIKGSANYGIIVGDSENIWDTTTNNIFRNNNLAHLDLVDFEEDVNGRTYTEAHILFDLQSAGNVYYGKKGETVIDFGTNNQYQSK